MARRIALVLAIVLFFTFVVSSASAQNAVRIRVDKRLASGVQPAVLTVWDAREGGRALATETRSVRIDRNGTFETALGTLGAVAGEERWLGIQVGDVELPRVRLTSAPPAKVEVISNFAIYGGGIIESGSGGFRFPDGSIQTSAATVSGGVPSVNGIGAAVTIAGAGTTSVNTVGSTITVTGTGVPSVNGIAGAVTIATAGTASVGTSGSTVTITGGGLSGVTAGSGLTGGGTSGSPSLSASYDTNLPSSVAPASLTGVSANLARSDHVHAHGANGGGSLHSTATTGSSGFLSSSDKTKLDALVPYVRTIVVSPAGSAAASGTALLAALAGITGATVDNPYLLKIEPGVYDIGATPLTMKAYVDVEGSGENVTYIVAARFGYNRADSAAVAGANHAAIRQLTITNSAVGGSYAEGIYTPAGTMRIADVTVNVSSDSHVNGIVCAGECIIDRATVNAGPGGTGRTNSGVVSFGATGNVRMRNGSIKLTGGTEMNLGASSIAGAMALEHVGITVDVTGSIQYGLHLDSDGTPSVRLIDSTVIIQSTGYNYGVYASTGTLSVEGSTIRTIGGTSSPIIGGDSSALSVTVRDSVLRAEGVESPKGIEGYAGLYTIFGSQVHGTIGFMTGTSAVTLKIAHSMIASATVGSGTKTCVGAYNLSFVALNTSCE